MAKVPFSKLNLKVNTEVSTISCGEYNIEVRKYLPMSEKIQLIMNILNYAVDDNGFYNPLKVHTFLVLETVYTYTNLNFTAKMKEDGFKLYDIFMSTGLFEQIVNCIPSHEWEDLQRTVQETIQSIYSYKNSVMGVLDTIKQDYSSLNLDLETVKNNIADPEQLDLLKQIILGTGLND